MPSNQDPQGYPKLDIKAARALNPRTQTIRIESILGGQTPMSHFGKQDQFESSIGIDPFLGINDSIGGAPNAGNYAAPSGLLRPSEIGIGASLTGLQIQAAPMFFRQEPKLGDTYAFGAYGSIYVSNTGTVGNTGAAGFTGLSDAGAFANGGSQVSEGMEYYDNYMYFATPTDIVRYGPLNGAAAFNSAYWTNTLGKAALTATVYPPMTGNTTLPRHPMHRHSDGKLYIGDVVGNQGTLHYIATKKTTVEGDTDDSSTFSKLILGYGLWPTAIESYGSQLVIAFYEGSVAGAAGAASSGALRSKVAFWDTTSQNFNSIVWVEFPDELISSIKNIDGTLYFISGSQQHPGFRVSRYIGGTSFADVYINTNAIIPNPGAVDGDTARLLIATQQYHPTQTTQTAAILSIGTGRGIQGLSIYNIGGSGGSTSAALSLCLSPSLNYRAGKTLFICTSATGGTTTYRIIGTPVYQDALTYDYSTYTRKWLSQKFKIGQPFKITKIRIPFAQPIAANMIVTPYLIFDEITTVKTLSTINNTNYPGALNVTQRVEGATGQHSFQLELQWTGSALCTVDLPITIEYELIDD